MEQRPSVDNVISSVQAFGNRVKVYGASANN